MSIKNILLVSMFALTTSGCCLPIGSTYYVGMEIPSETISNIASDNTKPVSERSIPSEIRDIEGSTVSVHLKDSFCPCSKQRSPRMSVTLVSKTGLSGQLKYRWSSDENGEACNSFAEADAAITEAYSLSKNYSYFYLDGFKLIWEALAALQPLECDPGKAKILANKAKLLAQTVGAQALGFDISGTYDSEITGMHPIVERYNTLIDQHKPKLIIKQDGQKITGVDTSGTVLLVGTRVKNVIYFKFSYPDIPNRELEGKWIFDNFNNLFDSGTWRDTASNVSGEWKLMKVKPENPTVILANSDTDKYLQKFLSQRDAIEVNYEVIDYITGEEERSASVCGAPLLGF